MKILILQPVLKQYRVPLFERMGDLLAEQGHELRVVCGSPPAHELSKGDNVLTNDRYWVIEDSRWFFNGKLHWLPRFWAHICWADLVITEQANKHIHNYFLLILRGLGRKRFAYWGHGQNRQGNPKSWREKIKKRLVAQCDWWFAYTEGVARYVVALGYPNENVTVLNNSIDTSQFRKDLSALSASEVAAFKRELGIDDQARIALFCGSLYVDKKIDFLLSSTLRVWQRNPDFVLLVAGDGNGRQQVEAFAAEYPFVKYLGSLFGERKALAFKSAELFLCPGLVGLAILDAFVAGLPLLTCDIPNHSPEIEYLQSGYNGVMTVANVETYAQAVEDVLADSSKLLELRGHALSTSEQFSIENMALNFVDGIGQCLKFHLG